MNQTIQKMLGLDGNENELSPWITLGIEEIRKRNDIDLFVIAPFTKISRNRTFIDGNINYYCVRIGVPFLKRKWPARFRFDLWTDFLFFNMQVRYLISRINPDLVELKGAENAYYSSSVLKIRRYPVLVTIQGFIALNYQSDSNDLYVKKRLQVEKAILSRMRYFGVEAGFMETLIKEYNNNPKVFFFHHPYARLDIRADSRKDYDVVFFARIDRRKGIEDLLKAILIVKTEKPDVTLLILGKGDPEYIRFLGQFIEDNDLKPNIHFRGFVPTQDEMLREAAKALISVLPTYNDTIPGTVVESMHMGIPIITYDTGGNPDLNKKEQNIIIVERGNIKELASEISGLLKDESRRQLLSERAARYASVEFNNENSVNQMILAYNTIIRESKDVGSA